MATTLIILGSACLMAALAPLSARPLSWLDRFARRFNRRDIVAEPPRIKNDAGWHLIHSENEEDFRGWLGKDSEGLPFEPGEMPSLGSHLLVELFGCDPETLKTESVVGEAMRSAAVESKATVVEQSFHEFKPWGVSGAVIIQESHYTIHTWPEHGYAAVDLFYCGGTVHVDQAVEVLRKRFQPKRIKFLVVRRGVQSEVEA
ncbi:MAG: adenosylmethionine decarboxylase [Fimbriimonadaceae bacterium]|nr:adenosylmethionine decarboxylase [Fimbriimonadaceae bacterium]QYK56882.1 MAG: adenosylmethionine decarboxylase [Fimbriimonadaceae bacterium]